MKFNNEKIYYVSSATENLIFDMDESVYVYGDDVCIGMCDKDLYGTKYACEGYWEEAVGNREDIENIFKVYDIYKRTDQHEFKLVDKDKFIDMVYEKYKQMENVIEMY